MVDFKREAAVKRRVTAALKRYPNIWRFMPVQTGFGVAALDYLVCINGRFVAIETKASNGRLTDRQRATIAAIYKAGGLVYIIRGIDEAKAWATAILPKLVDGTYDAKVDNFAVCCIEEQSGVSGSSSDNTPARSRKKDKRPS